MSVGPDQLPDSPDNRIIKVALFLQNSEADRQTVLVTKDINMQLKARAAGLHCVEDYMNEQQIDDISYLASGFFVLADEFFDTQGNNLQSRKEGTKNLYRVKRSNLPIELDDSLHLNQYWFSGDGLSVENVPEYVYQVVGTDDEWVDLHCLGTKSLLKREAYGIRPRSLLQALALHALLDPNITLVQLTGPAGSGKTLLALAAALEQSNLCSGQYNKIILTRSATDMAEEIGFLPGTEEEKMMPWLAAFTDSMEVLCNTDVKGHSSDKVNAASASAISMKILQDKSNMQFRSLTFMRGRNFVDAFIILDEAQNLNPHQMRSLITRVGGGSKMVVLGNLNQIDGYGVTALNSGLTHAVDKMRHFAGSTVVCLPGGERSPLASFAEENL